MAEETQQGIPIPVRWDRVEDVSIVLANQVLGQVGLQGEIILTFGQVTPPALTGDVDHQRKQAEEIPFVPAKPVARLALTRAGLDDLMRILRETQLNYDNIQETKVKQPEESSEE